MHLFQFAHITVGSELVLPELRTADIDLRAAAIDLRAADVEFRATGGGLRTAAIDLRTADLDAGSNPPDVVLRFVEDDAAGVVDWLAPSSSVFETVEARVDESGAEAQFVLDIRRRADGWVFDFPPVLRCHLAEDRRTLTCAPAADTPIESVRHIILDQILPYVLALRDDIVLHASGVAVDGGAIAFIGPSGMGKSTLATALGQEGYGVLTDDCAVVRWEDGGPVMEPTYPGLRLWAESVDQLLATDESELSSTAHYMAKVRAVPTDLNFVDVALPLRGILVIDNAPDDDPGRVTITPLGPGEATFALVEEAFIVVDGLDARSDIFDHFTRLAAAVPVAYITVPDDFDRLPCVQEAVAEWAVNLPH